MSASHPFPTVVLLFLVGVALMAVAAFDAIWTTLALKNAGPVTGRLAGGIWTVLQGIHRRRRSHTLLTFGGTVIVLCTLGVWLVCFWFGWALIFAADPGAVVHAQTGAEATFLERLYFAGFTLTTLGMGDYVPVGGWKVATVLSAGSGLVLITLSITYFAPVIDAVMAGRSMATLCAALGGAPNGVLLRSWDDGGFGHLEPHLKTLATELHRHTHRHHGYPVIHYFHAPHSESSVPLRLAVLDETLTLLEYAVVEEERPDPIVMRLIRSAVDAYMEVITTVYIDDKRPAPPPPDLEPLRRAGVPLIPQAEFARALVALEDRRRILHTLVWHDGWTWEDVVASEDLEPLEPVTRHE